MTVKYIKKRDGRVVKFNKEKIHFAILKAFEAVWEDKPQKIKSSALTILDKVISVLNKKFKNKEVPNVEDIQDVVEQVLIENQFGDIAKAYIIYRYEHSRTRDVEKNLSRSVEMIDSYLGRSDWKVNENSNRNFSGQGLRNYVASEVMADYWMEAVYPKEISEAHQRGDLHIHDLSDLSTYCCGWDLEDILMNGFKGVFEKVESGPARHFNVALMQLVNFFYTLQGESAGAQAVSSFDTYLAPFIKYDSLTYKEVKQAMQVFIYNINVPTRVGFQTPFTNITMDLTPPSILANQPVIIGGKPQKETYGEFQKEMDMVNKAFAEVMVKGDVKGRLFSFPIPTYNITSDFDWSNPVYKPIWEMTGKYGIPYFANFINSDMSPDDVRSMCCRLRLDNRDLRKRGGGLFGANPLTGSIGVVTLNLPRIGYLSKTKKEYIERVYKLMDIAKKSLEIKRKAVEEFTEKGLYPYSKYYLRNVKKRFGSYWENHFNTIGILGMNESLLNFMGKEIYDSEGKDFAVEVLKKIKERLLQYQEETGSMYNLEATPGEGTTYRFAMKDKELFGNTIIVANEDRVRKQGAAPYYTNSTHLPVDYTADIFDALDLQDSLQAEYTGGTVFHGFLGENIIDTDVVKLLVKRIAENYNLSYYTITPTFSICPVHGYLSGEHEVCPKCVAEIEAEKERKEVN